MKQIKLEMGNVYSKIVSDIPQELSDSIKNVCSYEQKYYDKKAGFEKSIQLSIYNEHNKEFPSGLIKRVIGSIDESGYRHFVRDYRDHPNVDVEAIVKRFDEFEKPLRDYQLDGGLSGIEELSGLYDWATGAGKTVEFTFLLMAFDEVSLILVNRKELMKQIASELSRMTGRSVGMIGDGKWQPSKWTVAIVNSLRDGLNSNSIGIRKRTENFLSKIRVFIGDEIHHLGSVSWKGIARACSNAAVRFGFSGTCFHPDSEDLYLVAYTSEVLSKVTASKLIHSGWLAQPFIYSPEIQYKGPHGYVRDWHGIRKHLIRENDKVNESGCKFLLNMYNQGHTAMFFAGDDVVYGKQIFEMLLDMGIHEKDIRYMNGKENPHVRDKVLEDFRNKRFQILGGTSIYDEGIDVPHTVAGANFGQGYSEIKTRQRIGRILRKTRPKGHADVDPNDFQKKFYWDPINAANSITEKHSEFRQSIYSSESGFKLFRKEYKPKK